MSRLLVCGSRDLEWSHFPTLLEQIYRVHVEDAIEVLMHGAGGQADTMAGVIGRALMLSVLPFPADWDHFRAIGNPKGAGPARNRHMLQAGKPTRALAFINKPLTVSRGTMDMVNALIQHRIPVDVVRVDGNVTITHRGG